MKHSRKYNKAQELYRGFKGANTLGKVFERIPEELIERLTSAELAMVAEIIAKAYNDGRASTGAEMIDKNAVWVDSLGKIIDWYEEGAEYETVTETIPGGKRTYSRKIKDGIMVAKICD